MVKLSDIAILYLAILNLNDPKTYKANRLALVRYLIAAQELAQNGFYRSNKKQGLGNKIPSNNIRTFANAMNKDKRNGLLDNDYNFNQNIKNQFDIVLKSKVLKLQLKDWSDITVDKIGNILLAIQQKKSR